MGNNLQTPLQVTGLILAGGKGMRMGGVDKGLQALKGRPLVTWVMQALGPQVQSLLLNANRNQDAYRALGVPVLADPPLHPDQPNDHHTAYAGPLAGMLAGLRACHTPWLVTAPCDTPVLPTDYVARLYRAAQEKGSRIAMVRAVEQVGDTAMPAGTLRRQPVFSLIHRELTDDLAQYLASGERKIDRWMDRHQPAMVDFEPATTSAFAFANINTLQDLGVLESQL